MPDQFGNPTPLEVLAQITHERDQLLSRPGLDPQDRRLATMAAMGKAVFAGFDPRVVKAQEIENVFRQAQSERRREDESQMDYEIRVGRSAFDQMKNVDPITAASISERVTKMEELRADRQRLLAQEAREVEEHKMRTEEHEADMRKDLLEGLRYEVDPRSGTVTGLVTYQSDPDHMNVSREVGERKNILLDADAVAGLINTKVADMKLWNNSLFGTKLSTVQGAHETAVTGERLMDLFIEAGKQGINTQTYYQTLERGVQSLVEAKDEAFRALGSTPPPAVGSDEFNEDRSNAAKFLQGRQLPAGVTESTIVRLAYTWAKSFDNRVTNQDFEKAYQMLTGGGGNPAGIANNIRAATFERYQQLEETISAEANDLLKLSPQGSEGHAQGTMLNNAFGRYREAVGRFGTKSESLMEMWEATPSGTEKPVATNERRVGNEVFRARRGE